MFGRGSRKHPGKENCLVLDFTSNLATHGPVDLITMDGDGEVKGQAARICEGCGALMDPRVKTCPACGWYKTRICHKCQSPYDVTLPECPDCGAVPEATPRVPKHADRSYGGAILSTDDAPLAVTDWWLRRHEKPGGQPSVRVGYFVGALEYCEWICPEHTGYARQKASAWWVRRGGKSPTPQTVDEAILRQDELTPPTSIRVVRDGKHWRVSAAY
jgi:DNA repair protein RadD